MDNKQLKEEILKLLPASTIPTQLKQIVTSLLPLMKDKNLQGVYDALSTEKEKLDQLKNRKNRLELKYKVMVEKLTQIEENK